MMVHSMVHSDSGMLAVDMGSSRVKLGWFAPAAACYSQPESSPLPISAPPLPEPTVSLTVLHRDRDFDAWSGDVRKWLADCLPAMPRCVTASVHREASNRLQGLLSHAGAASCHELLARDFNIDVRVTQPDKVGVDRLLNAVAVNKIRAADEPAIVIDAGTAVTIDLVAANGAFEGGAILPGLSMSLAALHSGTTSLPLLTTATLENRPDAVGKSTAAAIAAGVYWSVVGGIGRLIELQANRCRRPPIVFLTGGAAQRLIGAVQQMQRPVRHIPHLTLAGIAIASSGVESA